MSLPKNKCKCSALFPNTIHNDIPPFHQKPALAITKEKQKKVWSIITKQENVRYIELGEAHHKVERL